MARKIVHAEQQRAQKTGTDPRLMGGY